MRWQASRRKEGVNRVFLWVFTGLLALPVAWTRQPQLRIATPCEQPPEYLHLDPGTFLRSTALMRSARVSRGAAALTTRGITRMPRSTQRRSAAVVIILAAFASLVLSVTLWFTGNREQGLYVGLWVPSILSFGSVALLGSRDRND